MLLMMAINSAPQLAAAIKSKLEPKPINPPMQQPMMQQPIPNKTPKGGQYYGI